MQWSDITGRHLVSNSSGIRNIVNDKPCRGRVIETGKYISWYIIVQQRLKGVKVVFKR